MNVLTQPLPAYPQGRELTPFIHSEMNGRLFHSGMTAWEKVLIHLEQRPITPLVALALFLHALLYLTALGT